MPMVTENQFVHSDSLVKAVEFEGECESRLLDGGAQPCIDRVRTESEDFYTAGSSSPVQRLSTREADVTAYRIDSSDSEGGDPEEETSSKSSEKSNSLVCCVCAKILGLRRLRRKHRCRVCKREVCSKCSPSRLELEGRTGVHRVCRSCAATVVCGPELQQRLGRLSQNVRTMISLQDGSFQNVGAGPPQDLNDAVASCEASLVKTHEKLCRQRQLSLSGLFSPSSTPTSNRVRNSSAASCEASMVTTHETMLTPTIVPTSSTVREEESRGPPSPSSLATVE